MTLADDIARYVSESGDGPVFMPLVQDIAAGLERENIIIPKTDLPNVIHNPESRTDTYVTSCEVGPLSHAGTSVYDAEQCMVMARSWLALAEHLTARESEAATLERRRDELAQEFAGDAAYAYRFADRTLQVAIDRIVELEGKP